MAIGCASDAVGDPEGIIDVAGNSRVGNTVGHPEGDNEGDVDDVGDSEGGLVTCTIGSTYGSRRGPNGSAQPRLLPHASLSSSLT